ncbi:bifunctional hydroxymethylpyrimidine kinase/phosphomethylpyrimidine kinase [Klebsiella pneumoniae]|nr:bifunctional hydroxymethylpyrimidine kinase/phosphomethylpyrimidine kinase [Klebsiella pneumoniae]
MLEQGRALLALGCGAVLMKGGHLDDAARKPGTGSSPAKGTAVRRAASADRATHGTGWPVSAALAAALRPRRGRGLGGQQVGRGEGLAVGGSGTGRTSLEVGHGIGPVHHFHAWW